MARIPTFYRVAFTWFDVLISAGTAVMAYARPQIFTEMYVRSMVAHTEEIAVVIWCIGAMFAYHAIIQGVVLRYTDDLRVWKASQFATLVLDWQMVFILYAAAQRQGTLDPASWTANDWGSWILTAGVIVIRTMFLLDVGIAKEAQLAKKVA